MGVHTGDFRPTATPRKRVGSTMTSVPSTSVVTEPPSPRGNPRRPGRPAVGRPCFPSDRPALCPLRTQPSSQSTVETRKLGRGLSDPGRNANRPTSPSNRTGAGMSRWLITCHLRPAHDTIKRTSWPTSPAVSTGAGPPAVPLLQPAHGRAGRREPARTVDLALDQQPVAGARKPGNGLRSPIKV